MLVKARLLSLWMVICLGLIALPMGAPAQAQDPTPDPKAPLKMVISSPFAIVAKPVSLLAKRGKWFPVAVTLTNSGDPVAGEVHLRLVTGNDEEAANDFTAPVDLPTNARKVVWIYGRLERPNINFVEISFSGRGFETLSERVPLQEPNEGQRVILTVSDVDSGLSEALRGLRGDGLSLSGEVTQPALGANPSQGPLRPLETSREGVPDRWIGMEMADLLVLGDFPHTALAPPQLEALRGFVAGGGNLLALGGANAPRLSSSPLADLWPVSIAGSGTASAGQTSKIVERFVEETAGGRTLSGADKLGGAPLVTARGTLKPGASERLGTPKNPLFSVQDVGAGRVLLLGFDPSQPPFVGWSGQNELWHQVFTNSVKTRVLDPLDGEFAALGPSGNPAYNSSRRYNGRYGSFSYNENQNDTLTGRLFASLRTAQQRRTPPVSQIAWFLALYVFVLVPLNYSVLRFIDRRELAWISIPLIVAAFSFFAYTFALNIRGKTILTRQVDIVQSSLGSKQARADSMLWLFSPRTTRYALKSEMPSAAIADYATQEGIEQGTFSVLQPTETRSFELPDAPVRIWVDRAFSAQSVPDLKSGVTRSGDRITNGTPFDLEGAVWVQDRQTRALGSFKRGATVSIPARATETTGGLDLPGAIARASKIEELFKGQVQDNGIPSGALSVALEGVGQGSEGAFLIGWSKKAAAPLSIGVSGAEQNDLALFVFRADPFQAARATTKIAGREAIVTRTVRTQTPAQLASAVGGGTDTYECLLPDAQTYTLTARGTGSNAVPQQFQRFGRPRAVPTPVASAKLPVWVHFEVFDITRGVWRPLVGKLRRDNSPVGGWTFSARVGRELAREPDRLLKIRVKRDNERAQVSVVRVAAA